MSDNQEATVRSAVVEVRGRARHVEFRTAPPEFGPDAHDWLSFHVEGLDPSTGRPFRCRVVMRSNRVAELTIRDGDNVVVRGTRHGENELRATMVESTTANSRLDLGHSNRLSSARLPLAIMSLAAIPAFILALVALFCQRLHTCLWIALPCLAIWSTFWLVRRRTLSD